MKWKWRTESLYRKGYCTIKDVMQTNYKLWLQKKKKKTLWILSDRAKDCGNLKKKIIQSLSQFLNCETQLIYL